MRFKQSFLDRELLYAETSGGRLRLASIFVPIYLETLLNCTIGTINTALISRVSETAVGAIGASNQLIEMYNTIFSVVVMGTTAVVSNHLGGERNRHAEAASTVSVVFAASLAIVLGVLLCLLRLPVLSLMHISQDLLPLTGTYYGFRTAFLVMPTTTTVLNALMRCYGYSRPGVYSGLLSNIVNLLGTLVSVRLLHDDLNAVILGVSISCVLGQASGLACSSLLFRCQRIRLRKPENYGVWNRNLLTMLKIGLPGAMSTMGYTISQTVTTSFVGSLGATLLSAKIFYSSVAFYCCMFSSSMGNANSVLIGYLCGQRLYDKADTVCYQLTRLTCVINLTLSCLLWLLRRQILLLFTTQEEILAMSTIVFAIDIVVEQSRARSQIYEYALRATGDTFFSMVGILISCWISGVGAAWLFGIRLRLGLPGIWIGFALDEMCRAFVTYGRWRSHRWIAINKKTIKQ